MHTIESVKAELPQVPVILRSGVKVFARVTGRRLDYPRVSIVDPAIGQYIVEFSWPSLVRCLNEDRALVV